VYKYFFKNNKKFKKFKKIQKIQKIKKIQKNKEIIRGIYLTVLVQY